MELLRWGWVQFVDRLFVERTTLNNKINIKKNKKSFYTIVLFYRCAMLCEVMKTMSSSVEGKGNNLQLTTYNLSSVGNFSISCKSW